MNKIEVEVEVDMSVGDALSAIFDDADAKTGTRLAVNAEEAVIELESCDEGLGFDETTLIGLAISFGVGFSSSFVASVIFDAVGKSIRRITIGGKRVRPTQEELTKALEVLSAHISKQSQD